MYIKYKPERNSYFYSCFRVFMNLLDFSRWGLYESFIVNAIGLVHNHVNSRTLLNSVIEFHN